MIKLITELQALAQTGLTYSRDKFDTERYNRFMEIAAELLAANSNHEYKDVISHFKKESGYATPKLEVRGAVFRDEKILLVQEKNDGLWSLPGGWADVNLSPKENILKEIKEEAGLHCSVKKLVGVYDKTKSGVVDRKWPHVYKMIFLCQIESEQQFEFDNKEIQEIRFFEVNKLPQLSLERVIPRYIEACFNHHKNPTLVTEFE